MQKILGADFLKLQHHRLERSLVDRKNSKQLQKMLEQKQFKNIWEVEKNPSIELVEAFLDKVDQKSVASAKIILTKKMSTNQSSQFRYRVFTNSSFEILIKSQFWKQFWHLTRKKYLSVLL